MKPFDVPINALARALRVPPSQMSAIVREKRGVTLAMAMGRGRYFGTSAEMWMSFQQAYELEAARDKAAGRIEREVLPRAS